VVGVTARIRLGVQSRLVPGSSLRERRETALRYGFDGIELSGPSMLEMAAEAIRDGVEVSAICSGHRGWLIDPDPAQVRAARDDIGQLLELAARLHAPLILVPIYGRNRKFPGMDTGRTPEEDESLWLEGLRLATDRAEAVGAQILVEPINRYENSVTITVADALRWASAMNSACVRPMADVFHMNIEEADLGAAIESAGPALGYVHLGDSQRLEPGHGHLDWDAVFGALHRIGYDGWATMECNLSGPAEYVLPAAASFVRGRIAARALA
jgi:sugar phosphate isomerase/epimerase